MISKSEAEIINAARHDILGISDKTSRDNLKDIFARMSATQRVVVDDPELTMRGIDVELHRGGPHGEGAGEGGEGILRRFRAGAPVGNHQKIR